MSSQYRLHLLGNVQLHCGDQQVHGFESRKALAMLAYLAMNQRAVARGELAVLFWADKSRVRGLRNLSRVLTNLNHLWAGCCQSDRHTVHFAPPPFGFDVAEVERLLAKGDEEALTTAVSLYRGDFMDGFYLDDCPEIEIWMATERELWREQIAQALHTLLAHHTRRGDSPAALQYANRLLQLNPWREETHRQKMLLLARAGQRTAALRQYDICRRMLADELGVPPADQTTALYERIAAIGTRPRHRITTQMLTPFVGRKQETADISALLLSPDCRLLTLVGLGGVGKSRLALAVAAQNRHAFLDGMVFVRLSAVESPELVAAAIAQAVALPLQGDAPPREQVMVYLKAREMLLILDNFEHLLEAAPLVGDILAAAPQVKIMVTSRERLNVQGEWVRDVWGLAYPDPDAADAAAYEAVQLFLERARRVSPAFSWNVQTQTAVSRICALVEGIPLGIELAAAWVRALSVNEILAEIAPDDSGGLDLTAPALISPLRDAKERHRSLQRVVDSSWRQLAADEQAAFQRLSLFRGGFDSAAAAAVSGQGRLLLSALMDKSLLYRDENGRFHIHELLRQYAAAKLRRHPAEEEAARRRHAHHFAAFLQQRKARLDGTDQKAAQAEISVEIENVRAGWGWMAAYGMVAELEMAVDALALFYNLRGWFQESAAVFEQTATQLQQQVGDAWLLLAKLWGQAGDSCTTLGEPEKAAALLRDAVAVAERHELGGETAVSRNRLGVLTARMGDFDTAAAHFHASLAAYRQLPPRPDMGFPINNLAIIARINGEYAQAAALSRQSLEICRRHNHPRGTARALQNLGNVANGQKQYQLARTHYEESLRLHRAIDDPSGISLSLMHLGDIALQMGDFDEAERFHRESLSFFQQNGVVEDAALCLIKLGASATGRGRGDEARQHLRRALKTAVSAQAVSVTLDGLATLAALLISEQQPVPALRLLAYTRPHPALWSDTKESVQTLLHELEAVLPADQIAAALAAGETAVLETGGLTAVLSEAYQQLRAT